MVTRMGLSKVAFPPLRPRLIPKREAEPTINLAQWKQKSTSFFNTSEAPVTASNPMAIWTSLQFFIYSVLDVVCPNGPKNRPTTFYSNKIHLTSNGKTRFFLLGQRSKVTGLFFNFVTWVTNPILINSKFNAYNCLYFYFGNVKDKENLCSNLKCITIFNFGFYCSKGKLCYNNAPKSLP